MNPCVSDMPQSAAKPHETVSGDETADNSDWTFVDPLCGTERSGDDAIRMELLELLGAGMLSDGDDCASPKSDDVAADKVLGEPLTPSSGSRLATRLHPSHCNSLEGVKDQLRAAWRAQEAEGHEQAAQQEMQALTRLSRLSQEGSLEGFANPGLGQPTQQQQPQQPTRLDKARSASSGWLASAWGLALEVMEEWEKLKVLLGQAICMANARLDRFMASAGLEGYKGLASLHTKRLRQAFAKAVREPSMALISVSAVTALSFAYIGHLWMDNHSLSTQLKQRDRDLARLVLRIMNLQEAVQSSRAALPILRHTAMQPMFAISSFA